MSDPRSDRTFKKIFHEHPRALIHLLNSFLPLKDPIVDIEYLPGELLADLDSMLMAIVDVRCQDSTGRHFIVEMQLQKTALFFRRVLLNACRIYSRQASKGGSLQEVNPVYTLCLLDYFMFPESAEWIHHIEPGVLSDTGNVFGELHFTFVELRKWKEIGNFSVDDIRDAWMLFFTEPERMLEVYTPEQKARLKEMLEAVDAWDLSKHTERDLYVMDKQIDNLMTHQMYAQHYHTEGMEKGMQEGLQKGLQEGLQQGLEQGRKEASELARMIVRHLVHHPDRSDVSIAEELGVETEEVSLLRASLQ